MDKEFKRWMKWYGKKHGEYTVSVCSGDAPKRSPLFSFIKTNVITCENFSIVTNPCILDVVWSCVAVGKGRFPVRRMEGTNSQHKV